MISGAIDALGSQKTAKFLNLCNHFGCESNFYTSSIWLTGVPFSLPIINLVDQPGFAIGMYGSSHPTAPALISTLGSMAERTATIRHGASAMAALYQATIPIYTVILRRAFGVAGGAFADPNDGATARVSW